MGEHSGVHLNAARERLTLLAIDAIKWVANGKNTSFSKVPGGDPERDSAESGIRPGKELQVVAKGGTITLIPDRTIASMRGFIRGFRTKGFREKKDRI